jgi:hypothetical protein
MQAAVKIVDVTPGMPQRSRPALRLASQTVTAGELISERIIAECRQLEAIAAAADRRAEAVNCLVVPGESEAALNGSRLYGPSVEVANPADPKPYTEIARRAFESRQFVMLFNNTQVEQWDQRLVIGEDSLATFIRLTPLKGG